LKRSRSSVSEKLQKILARVGVGSRRQIERWIEEGRVTVDGKPATLGMRATSEARIAVDGRAIPLTEFTPKPRVLIYHKPEGEVCTRADPQGRKTVFENLPPLRHGRWITIGRLDYNTSGLLLLTTDGDLAHRLMHPSHEIEREYAVRILGEVKSEMFEQLRAGVPLEDGLAKFDDIIDAGGTGANRWYHVILREGRNREVRRMWEAVGAIVSRLIRVRYGNIGLPRLLRPGRSRELEPEEAGPLYESVGLTLPAAKPRKTLRLRETSAAPRRHKSEHRKNDGEHRRQKKSGNIRRKSRRD
jgi:23S rRNA pseudouridine2605 synthase